MRGLPCCLLLWAISGCDAVFGLDFEEPDDLDPPAPDAPVDADCTSGGTVSLTAVADSFLEAEVENGARALLALDGTRAIVVKFAAPHDVRHATLRLHRPAMARGCATGGTACEACPAGTTGSVTAQWMRPDWNEHATATARDDAGRLWDGIRASSPTDLGTSALVATYTEGTMLELALMRETTDQRAQWAGGESDVALRISTSAAVGVFASRDAVEDSCGPAIAPTLDIGCLE